MTVNLSLRNIQGSLVPVLGSFALVTLFDRVLRSILLEGRQGAPLPLQTVVLSAFIEEGLYSGVLLTRSRAWMLPRLASCLIVGMTAARAFVGETENALDAKIGLLWTLMREVLVNLPCPYKHSLLLAGDSLVFAFSEVCPEKSKKGLPPFGPEWFYKVLSASFFRAVLNTTAKTQGVWAAVTQHALFNLCSSLS